MLLRVSSVVKNVLVAAVALRKPMLSSNNALTTGCRQKCLTPVAVAAATAITPSAADAAEESYGRVQ